MSAVEFEKGTEGEGEKEIERDSRKEGQRGRLMLPLK